MNQRRAFCTNELHIVIVMSALGLAIFLPALKFLRTCSAEAGLITLLTVLLLFLGALFVSVWAERRENHDLQDICYFVLYITALPSVGCFFGLLYFLGKILSQFPW